MKKRIFNFTNIASHYRKNLWEKLVLEEDFDFFFFYGKNRSLKIKEIDFSSSIFTKRQSKINQIKNVWIKGRVLIWQTQVAYICLTKKIDLAIFLGEFQVISTWFSVLFCKIRGIKVAYWTHGIYGNESFLKKKIRLFFYNTADELILYERRAKRLLVAEGFDENKIKVIFNSLDYDTHKKLREDKAVTTKSQTDFFKDNTLPYLIFVGRITGVKKIDMLVKAIKIINDTNIKVNLLVVGDGPEKEYLETITSDLNLKDNISFFGSCYDEIKLANFIYHSNLCVSPGNVGLTAIHALSFGTPVCTHNNFFNQMPEVEVIEEGFNGCFFKENDINSLAFTINKWLENNISNKQIKDNCYKVIDELYNPYNQLTILKEIL